MVMDFIYTFLNPGMESWLKEEVKARELPLNPSFQKTGFITFKILRPEFSHESIDELAYARSWGRFVYKGTPEEIPEQKLSIREVYQLNAREHWVGERNPRRNWKDLCCATAEVPEIKEEISRTYFKTQEAFDYLKLPSLEGKGVLEIGCAPGGSSQFFCQKGAHVIGVDPAEVDPRLRPFKNFFHLPLSVQKLRAAELPLHPKRIKVLSVDLNLGPRQSIKEVKRLMKELPHLELMLFILKTPKSEMARDILDWKKSFAEFSFSELFFAQLPSHRKEVLLVGLKKGSHR